MRCNGSQERVSVGRRIVANSSNPPINHRYLYRRNQLRFLHIPFIHAGRILPGLLSAGRIRLRHGFGETEHVYQLGLIGYYQLGVVLQ